MEHFGVTSHNDDPSRKTRPDKPRAAAIKAVQREWLLSSANGLTDAEIAVAMVPPHQRDEYLRKGGKTLLTQNAPRKYVKRWRAGTQRIDPAPAFRIGEALRNLGKSSNVSGFYALYKLGYVAELAKTLVHLSRIRNGRFSRAALTMYCVFPILERGRPFLVGTISVDDKLVEAKLKLDAHRLIEACDELLTACNNTAGSGYQEAWEEAPRRESPALQYLAFLDSTAEPSAPFDIPQRRSIAWKILVEWAIAQAMNCGIEDRMPEGWAEAALISLSLDNIWSSTIAQMQYALIDTLRSNDIEEPPQTLLPNAPKKPRK